MANKGYSQYGGNPYAGSGQYDGYGSQNQYEQQDAGGSYGTSQDNGHDGYGAAQPHGVTSGTYGSSHAGQTAGTGSQVVTHSNTQSTYGSSGTGGYGASDPYGTGAQQQSQTGGYSSSQPTRTQATPSAMAMPAASAPALSNQDFLARVEGARSDIRTLTTNVSEIGSLHQRELSSTETSSSSQLEHLITQTQILNTRIKDQIKYLEMDAAKDAQRNGKKNTTKESQVKTLKSNFKSQLEDYQNEESVYRQRYRDQIARQYRIVNPEASESEVKEATTADWNNQGVFQTALKSNRTGAASSVLGSVRARHNDIQQIEKTLIELSALFSQLDEAVVFQESAIIGAEEQTDNVNKDQEKGIKHLDKGIKSARNVKKMKWWCLGIAVLIVVILALVLGLYFGLHKNNNNNGT